MEDGSGAGAVPDAATEVRPPPNSTAPAPGLRQTVLVVGGQRVELLATILLDALFLIAVAAINYGAAVLLHRVALEGIDLFVLRILQILFAISTLSVVVINLAAHLWTAVRRAVRDSKASA